MICLKRFSLACSADLQVRRLGRPEGLHYIGLKNAVAALDDLRSIQSCFLVADQAAKHVAARPQPCCTPARAQLGLLRLQQLFDPAERRHDAAGLVGEEDELLRVRGNLAERFEIFLSDEVLRRAAG